MARMAAPEMMEDAAFDDEGGPPQMMREGRALLARRAREFLGRRDIGCGHEALRSIRRQDDARADRDLRIETDADVDKVADAATSQVEAAGGFVESRQDNGGYLDGDIRRGQNVD